jgi:hypothetical protein
MKVKERPLNFKERPIKVKERSLKFIEYSIKFNEFSIGGYRIFLEIQRIFDEKQRIFLEIYRIWGGKCPNLGSPQQKSPAPQRGAGLSALTRRWLTATLFAGFCGYGFTKCAALSPVPTSTPVK